MSVTTIAQADRSSLYQARYDETFAAIRERGIDGGSLFRFVNTRDYGILQSGYVQRRDSRMFVILGEIDYASEPAIISGVGRLTALVYFSQIKVLQDVLSVDMAYYGGIARESWFDLQSKCSDWVAKDNCFYFFLRDPFLQQDGIESSLKPGTMIEINCRMGFVFPNLPAWPKKIAGSLCGRFPGLGCAFCKYIKD
ncbi:hypothetical protein B0H13DRAFT_1883481 [Mycena leptocephala]|nr:hypothetical protein B0H13DRAFT_1883481 [Mycena leptocephala]